MDTTPSRKVSRFAIKSAFLSVQQQKQQQKQQQLQLQRLQEERSLPPVKNLIRLFLRILFPKKCVQFHGSGRRKYKKGSRDGFPFCIVELIQFQDSHECTLRNFDRSDLPHPLLSLLLLFEELSLS